MMGSSNAFTLIELLVVVTIISILATMAVPNYLNAQIRAKSTVVTADAKVLADAMTIYYMDNGLWMPHLDGDKGQHRFLTTPVAYISEPIEDKFQQGVFAPWRNGYKDSKGFLHAEPFAVLHEKFFESEPDYYHKTQNAAFFVWSFGPDQRHDDNPAVRYDITNGIDSPGDVIRAVDGMYTPAYPYLFATYEEQNRAIQAQRFWDETTETNK